MKIMAVPLARNGNPARVPYLTYISYTTSKGERKRPSSLPLSQRIMVQASNAWSNLGREDSRSLFDWKRRIFLLGERIMDRIEYEEWALKGIDQALGPSIRSLMLSRRRFPDAQQKRLSLLYPPSLVSPSTVLESIRRMASRRQPHHKWQLLYNTVGIIVTSPLFLVPAIPNLPTYYLLWRLWSHYRAYTACKSVSTLLEQDLIDLAPDAKLDDICAQHEDGETINLPDDWKLFMGPRRARQLMDAYELPEQCRVDLMRASMQAQSAISKNVS
ncbi:hypothetical protein MEQU1_001303 [Malassezia equina]|uniref:Mitochondrial K+-H+ exchange-related-domain-containing protein n=1 Tax=Malassezia equina TaxID=1381935 RepID=A0AAF0IY57_9BASI|nr:hypothetical protein MEQU1_001303 [Malassezia equina]